MNYCRELSCNCLVLKVIAAVMLPLLTMVYVRTVAHVSYFRNLRTHVRIRMCIRAYGRTHAHMCVNRQNARHVRQLYPKLLQYKDVATVSMINLSRQSSRWLRWSIRFVQKTIVISLIMAFLHKTAFLAQK